MKNVLTEILCIVALLALIPTRPMLEMYGLNGGVFTAVYVVLLQLALLHIAWVEYGIPPRIELYT